MIVTKCIACELSFDNNNYFQHSRYILSLSFIDIVSSFFDENLLSQITITLQNSFERARRKTRQQIKNVYSYDSIINQIIKSFFNDAFSTKAFNHLFFYFFFTVCIQISTSTMREIKQRRDIDRSRDRCRVNDVEKDISRS
jgi:predicted PurR-regulated permease PerM